MAQAPESDELRIVNLDTGDEFTTWESASITSEYMTPCDAFKVEAGADIRAVDIAKRLPPGARVQCLVNGAPQLTGYVDNAHITNGRGGRKVSIEGRDFLSVVVDSNVDPRMTVSKTTTIDQLCEKVLKEQFGLELTIYPYNDKIEAATGHSLGAKRKSYTGSKHKREKPLKDITPHDNEGAFTYLSRILTHHGYWLVAACDGSGVIVAGPDYDQAPMAALVSKYDPGGIGGGAGVGNNVKDSAFKFQGASVPSLVHCRGQNSNPAAKGGVLGIARTGYATRPTKVYISDNDATDKEKAERIARLFMARQLKSLLTYECTVVGLSNRTTGVIYQADTIVDVDDEQCGIRGRMWVESRTFEKSRDGGTTTKLKCIPPGMLVLDYQPDEAIPSATSDDAASCWGGLNPFAGGRYNVDDLTFLQPN